MLNTIGMNLESVEACNRAKDIAYDRGINLYDEDEQYFYLEFDISYCSPIDLMSFLKEIENKSKIDDQDLIKKIKDEIEEYEIETQDSDGLDAAYAATYVVNQITDLVETYWN